MEKVTLAPIDNFALAADVPVSEAQNPTTNFDLDELHAAPEESDNSAESKTLFDKLVAEVLKHPFIRNLNIYTSYFSALGSGISSVVNTFNKIFKIPKLAKLASNLGQLTTTLKFLGLGITSTLEQVNKKHYLTAVGHSIDNLVAFLPQSLSFLGHGFASGIYCLGNALSTAISKSEFSSLGDNLVHMKRAFIKCFNMLRENPIEHMKNEKTGLLGAVASMTILAGSSLWKLTGSPLMGATLRNLGEILQTLTQLNPQNIKSKPLYYSSGVWTAAGTVVDYIARIFESSVPGVKEILYPLSLAINAYGNKHFILYQRSNEVANG